MLGWVIFLCDWIAVVVEAADRVLPCVANEDLSLEEVGVVEENGEVALVPVHWT